MGFPSSPTSPHLYPQALQLKLYQAFIFSVPILFSIILFLLFYLFYLKRRASNLSSSPTTPPWRSNQANDPLPFTINLKEELKASLPIIMFDEDLRSRESQCCVCLGEFEAKEQLHQIPSCNHLFHIDCIHLWLQANTTCPLCRGSIFIAAGKKFYSSETPPPPSNIGLNSQQQMDTEADHHTQLVSSEPQQDGMSRTLINSTSEDQLGQMQGSTSRRMRIITQPSDIQELPWVSIDINEADNSLQ